MVNTELEEQLRRAREQLSITIDFACSATSGNISVTASNSCIGPSTAQTLAVTINALATPGAITGSLPYHREAPELIILLHPLRGHFV